MQVAAEQHCVNGGTDIKARSLDEQFNSAVDLIHNLPKTGSFQVSNEFKLKMYALFKQATVGRCTSPRPAFWDVVNRAKWDAWHSMSALSSSQAKRQYIDSLEAIVETMPVDANVENFLKTISPFYQEVDSNGRPVHSAPNVHLPSHSDSEGASISPLQQNSDDVKKSSNLSNKEERQSVDENIQYDETSALSASQKPVESMDAQSDEEKFADASDSISPQFVNGCTDSPIERRSTSTQSACDKLLTHNRRNDLDSLYEESWCAVEKLRTDGMLAKNGDHWSPTFYAPVRGRTKHRQAKRGNSDNEPTAIHDQNNAANQGSSRQVPPSAVFNTLIERDLRHNESSLSSSSSDLHSEVNGNFDPQISSVLFRMHRQLQQISTQLALVETSLITQHRLIAALVQKEQNKERSIWSSLKLVRPSLSIWALLLLWPIVVNVLGRYIWRRIKNRHK